MNSPNHRIFRLNCKYEELAVRTANLLHRNLKYHKKLVDDVSAATHTDDCFYYLPAEYNPNLFFNNGTFRRMTFKHG